jgi:two-component system, NtrC family, sensor histidine kinase KinB
MRFSLRFRILVTLVPLMLLLIFVGIGGAILLHRLGGSIDLILSENYASVIAMERLNEALERIDSSFQFALAGKEDQARIQYKANWPEYMEALRKEESNITLPGEAELVEELTALTGHYHQLAEGFYKSSAGPTRAQAYFGAQGLLQRFEEIKRVSGQILRINQENMEEASHESKQLARRSLFWFVLGLGGAALLALLLAFNTIRAILQPIQAITHSALAIGAGDLDQIVPVSSQDELGQLAQAFNTMGRQLRHYRTTDYARLLRAQRTSQATIDSFPDPVLVIDTEGMVEMANPAARGLLGVVPKSGKGPAVPWQPPDTLRQPVAEALQQQRDYLPEGFDRAISFRASGKDRYFLPRVLTIRDPYKNTLGAAVLFQDVTRFQLLDQVKSNLVATVSHELKTPLTSIRLAIHLLLEETVGSLNSKQTELLLDARDNAERLLATINNLLDLTHLEAGPGRLERKPEPLGSILHAAIDSIRPRADDKGIELQFEVPDDLPPVAVDVGRFGLALNNLLDNALTYTPRGGRISLSAAPANGTLKVEIADTGLGIPPEYLPRVFERFFRVPGRSRGGGTGLGLAIVREIVSAHGGSIECDSKEGEGTVFTISLPVERDR